MGHDWNGIFNLTVFRKIDTNSDGHEHIRILSLSLECKRDVFLLISRDLSIRVLVTRLRNSQYNYYNLPSEFMTMMETKTPIISHISKSSMLFPPLLYIYLTSLF